MVNSRSFGTIRYFTPGTSSPAFPLQFLPPLNHCHHRRLVRKGCPTPSQTFQRPLDTHLVPFPKFLLHLQHFHPHTIMSRKRARSESAPSEHPPSQPPPTHALPAEAQPTAASTDSADSRAAWRDPRTGEPRFDFMHPSWQAARRRTRRQAKAATKDLRPFLAQLDAERAAKRHREETEVMVRLLAKVREAKARGIHVSASQRRRVRRRAQAVLASAPVPSQK
jgi:hypothetical protein